MLSPTVSAWHRMLRAAALLSVCVVTVGTGGPATAGPPAATRAATVPAGTVLPAGAAVDRTPAASTLAATDLAGCPRSVWHDNDVPAVSATTSSEAVEVGVKFRTDRDGYLTGVRFYKGAGNTGTHIGRLWSTLGEKLAEATFTGESATGWQQVSFSQPVRVAAGTTYTVSYYAPAGRYSYTYDFFATAGLVRPPLSLLRNGASGPNGVYHLGPGYPTSTYRSINYWVDPVYDSTSAESCPASIWTDTQSPAQAAIASASSVELGVKFRASQDGFIQGIRFFKGAGNTGTHIGRLWSRTGAKLAEATFVAESGTGWQQAWFAQPVAVSAGTTYVASYLAPNGHYAFTAAAFAAAGVTRGPLTALPDGADGGNGVYLYGTGGFPVNTFNSANYGVDVLFTAASALACPCSVFPGTGEPSVQETTDAAAVELGLRFRPLRSGFIKGIRFYKAAHNSGTHIGSLWSNAGVSLARVTFTNETSAGWQQALFSNPVAVTAGTTYVASYLAPVGRYPFDESYFATDNAIRGPLAGLANGVGGGNGVYRYGGGFPSSTYLSANYWVDVVFDVAAQDTTAPVIIAQSPGPGAPAVATGARLSVRFSEAVVGSSVSISVQNPAAAAVSGTTSFDPTTNSAQFVPSAPLSPYTDYQVSVSGTRDAAGNVMAPATWMFTTAIDPLSGPGGPIGIITDNSVPYSSYYAEILRTEGLNEFSVLPIGSLSASALAGVDVAILSDIPVTDAQVAVLTAWVNGGGRLIAMGPDPRLAPLLGLAPTGTTLTNGYLAVDPSTGPGAGITTATMQFHGTADRYTTAGATTIATLYSSATAATANPAVTMRPVGTAGGQAAAFTFDLARSVALTRQGNPAWAGQERDNAPPIRSDDLFFGGTSAPDWVDLSKVAIPQADEQQRLLANMIELVNRDRRPLPRFWYLPAGAKAVVVSTGDDEAPGTNGTAGRFNRYVANSPAGCSLDDWQCLRFTSYVWPSVGLTDAQARAFDQQGFEVALHAQNNCNDFTPASLEADYASQLVGFNQKYLSIPPPQTARYHCIVYSDWDSQPRTEYRHDIRLDANYYYWPGSWIQNRPGFMTGSGIPMRFTDLNGQVIDVYQATTQMTNESGQTYPFTVNTLLDKALGPEGYYGVFTANMHDSNQPTSFEDDQLVASAQNHGVPVTTARNVMHWLDARDASSFSAVNWSANTLTFTVSAARFSRGLTALLPTAGVGGTTLSTLSRDGSPVSFTRVTVKGIEYAQFAAASGGYTGTYTVPAAAVSAASAVTPAADGTATVTWSSTVPANADISYATTPSGVDSQQGHEVVGESTRDHRVQLRGLVPGTTYYYRVRSRDARGRTVQWPAAGQVASFSTPAADTTAPAVSDLRITPLPDSTVRVSWHTDEPATSRVAFGTSAGTLDHLGRDDAMVTSHLVVLSNLDAQRQFHLRVSSADAAGNIASFPASGTAPIGFVTAAAGVADQTRVGFRTGLATGSLVVTGPGVADLTLTPRSAPGAPQSTGAFVSRVLDAAQITAWQVGVWDADVPAGTTVTVSVRTGNAAAPDASWSPWTAVTGSGATLAVPPGQYLQYRVELTAGAAAVPALHWIGFIHGGVLPGAARRTQHSAG